MNNIKESIEAVLFATGRIVSKGELAESLNVDIEEINKEVAELKLKYSEDLSGIFLVELDCGIQLVSSKKQFDIVTKFVENSKKQSLSGTCMEVLSIVAYNKNITKSEIEKIRGVNSDSQVSRLLEYGLIEETGRLQLPGRPATFATTPEFLKCMGINSVSELPEFENIGANERVDTENIEGQEKLDI